MNPSDNNRAIALIGKGERALQEAADIHEILDLRDQAAAIRVLADAKGFGEAAQKAKIFQLRAERKAGDWLSKTVKAGNPQLYQDGRIGLDDIGISANESSRWQIQAELPEQEFSEWVDNSFEKGKEISAAGLRRKVKEYEREQRIAEDQEASTKLNNQGDNWELHTSNFSELIIPQLEVIITDPPYPEKFLPLYDDLSEFAARTLTDGGSLVAMVNHAHLPEVLRRLSKHLTYRWTMAVLLKGPRARMFQRKINVGWKPIAIFTKGKYDGPTHTDVIQSERREKDRFEWQQNIIGFKQLVEIFSRPGDTVCDPMCGVGTTGMAAIQSGRYFIGIDIDPTKIASTKVRFQEHEMA